MRKAGMGIGNLVVAVAATVAIAACLGLAGCQSGGGGATATHVIEVGPAADSAEDAEAAEDAQTEDADDATQDGAEAEAQADSVVFQTDQVRITMPAEYASTCTWSQPGGGDLVSANAPDGSSICMLTWGETASHGQEIKGYGRIVGEVPWDGDGTVRFFTAGLDASGSAIYAGKQDEPAQLATEYFMGVTPEDVISWIEFASGDGWVAAQIRDEEPAETQASAANEPFWGIWVGASKDPAEAEAIADQLRARQFDAYVELTTDWSNLNSEPWYVITVNRSATEAQANALVGTVQSSGWEDAYVKYTGDHV